MDTLAAWDAFVAQYLTPPRAGYGLIAVAVLLFAILAFKLARGHQLSRFGTSAEGRVVRVSEEDDVDHAIIRFVDSAGREHEFRSDLPRRSGTIVVGESVKVRYDPAQPRRARQVGEPLRRAWLCLSYVIVAAVFAFIGIMFVGAEHW
jgi:hypothetical protein